LDTRGKKGIYSPPSPYRELLGEGVLSAGGERRAFILLPHFSGKCCGRGYYLQEGKEKPLFCPTTLGIAGGERVLFYRRGKKFILCPFAVYYLRYAVIFHNIPHFSRGRQKSGTKSTS
jgi:hypothetical protein